MKPAHKEKKSRPRLSAQAALALDAARFATHGFEVCSYTKCGGIVQRLADDKSWRDVCLQCGYLRRCS